MNEKQFTYEHLVKRVESMNQEINTMGRVINQLTIDRDALRTRVIQIEGSEIGRLLKRAEKAEAERNALRKHIAQLAERTNEDNALKYAQTYWMQALEERDMARSDREALREALLDMLNLIEEHGDRIIKAHATRLLEAQATLLSTTLIGGE